MFGFELKKMCVKNINVVVKCNMLQDVDLKN